MRRVRQVKGKRLNYKQRLVVVAMDLLLLTELTCSIFIAHHDMENVTAIFLRTFIPLALLTLIGTKIAIKCLDISETSDKDLTVQ